MALNSATRSTHVKASSASEIICIVSLIKLDIWKEELRVRCWQFFMPQSRTHYNDVTMSALAFQITSLTIVYSTVYSRRRSKKTSKLRVTGLCVGNSPVTGEFPAQRASNAENVSIWWRHHVLDFARSGEKTFAILYADNPCPWPKGFHDQTSIACLGLCKCLTSQCLELWINHLPPVCWSIFCNSIINKLFCKCDSLVFLYCVNIFW